MSELAGRERSKPIITSFERARKRVMKAIQARDLEMLQSFLHQYDLASINTLIEQHGASFLTWAVDYIESAEMLSFLVTNFPLPILQGLLRKNNYEILQGFLDIEFGGEFNKRPYSKEARVEKFKLLLSIDPEGVAGFMQNKIRDGNITAQIKQDYEQAERELVSKAALVLRM